MDTKSFIPPPLQEQEAAPPAYSDTMSSSSNPKSEPPQYVTTTSTTAFFASQIQDQLQHMTTQINSLQTQKSLLSHAKDEKILSLLTTEIQHYMSDFAHSGLQRGSLTLVPGQAIQDQSAVLSAHETRNPDEYDVIVKMRDKEADEYGDGLWFWNDEDMARRLAAYLKPASNPYAAQLPVRKENIAPSTGRGFLGRKKATSQSQNAAVNSGPLPSQSSAERIIMDVKAEEVCFRTENAFGIYESLNGWGVVLTLKIILAHR